jgi:hypothetical protein
MSISGHLGSLLFRSIRFLCQPPIWHSLDVLRSFPVPLRDSILAGFLLFVNVFWFEWRFSALPCVAYAELGLIHSFLALCAFSTLSTLSTGFQQNIAQ